DQHQVDVGGGQRRVTGHEARVPAHQLDQADAVAGAGRLDARAPNDLDGGGVRALEAEAAIDEVDVVVDGLGHRHHADLQGAPLDLRGQLHGPADGPVAPDHEEDVDAQRLEVVDHLARVLRS